MSEIQWKYLKQPVNDEQIYEIESELNIHFPKDFRVIVKEHHGARTKPKCVDVDGYKRVFGGLHSFDKDSEEYILLHCQYYEEHVEKGYIPFGRDPGGNNFYFDFNKSSESPIIVFWNHETDTFSKIASTFTEFLSLLHD